MFKKDKDIELLYAQSEVEQKKHDAQSTAKEVAKGGDTIETKRA